MKLRSSLIKIARKMEAAWQPVVLSGAPVMLERGWYITEFLIQGSLQHTPRIIIESEDTTVIERNLHGVHAGRNRLLIFLPEGQMVAFSQSIHFSMLSRVPFWEGRARILLICSRYLIDFFNPLVLLRMIVMQFRNPLELSDELLLFYAPPAEHAGYLHEIRRWHRLQRFQKILSWLHRRIKIAVLIEDELQREALIELMVAPDAILLAGRDSVPDWIDYVIPLATTEHLRSPAILMLKRAIAKAARARHGLKPQLVYTDHDYQFGDSDENRSMEPVFKPKPGAAYLYCFNYIGPSLAFSRDLVAQENPSSLLSVDAKYRIALQAFTYTSNVLHVDEALFTSDSDNCMQTPAPTSELSLWPDIQWCRRGDYNVLRASADWQDKPSVDLIIPTRDGLSVLRPCIESILRLTDYPNYQVIVVDNGSVQAETLDFFAEISKHDNVKVVQFPGEFNFSAINNFAVSQGSSDYVAMINNDIEAIHPDWLSQMMVWAKQPGVGIVGAKLLFGNGKVQHAGVTVGMGNAAGHIHRLEDGDSPGYQNRCVATQNMMAVTAACLVTRRKLFVELGGLDAKHFKVAYNDIDYCLRVEKLGLEIIWTPEARLYHHESVSRGDDMSAQHIERYFYELSILQKRWKTKGFVDKYYSKHLRISDEGVYPRIIVKSSDRLQYLQR